MRKLLMISACAIVITSSNVVALHFENPTIIRREVALPEKLLSTYNEALNKALAVHNLMTELPGLQVMAKQQKKMQSLKKKLEDSQKDLLKCNEQRLGRFKNSKEMLGKLRKVYEKKVSSLKSQEPYDEKTWTTPVAMEKFKLYGRKKEIEVELMSDFLKNGKKWGGKYVGRPRTEVSEDLVQNLMGTGLEELAVVDSSLQNATTATADFEMTLKKAQKDFVEKLASVGVLKPDFDITKTTDIEDAHQELMNLKAQHIAEAKDYIAKLDLQDLEHPKVPQRRSVQSESKKDVLQSVQEKFPKDFVDVNKTLDMKTPQQQQRMLIAAMEKDQEGVVFLTETNAIEIDQRIAEMKATKNLMKQFEELAPDVWQNPTAAEFDFSRCGD